MPPRVQRRVEQSPASRDNGRAVRSPDPLAQASAVVVLHVDISRRNSLAICSRRGLLRLGGLSLVGLGLPRLLRSLAHAGSETRRAPAKSCILFYLEGGPAHQDLWDMKPEAPAEIRGEFKPIPTRVPGLQFCEHLPMLAGQAHHLALVRSVSHSFSEHNSATYYALTGHEPLVGSKLIQAIGPENAPTYGSVLAKLLPVRRDLPAFVHLVDIMSNSGMDIAGQSAGFLGGAYDPLVAGDPSVDDYRVPGLALSHDVTLQRLGRRRSLAESLDRSLARIGENPALERLDSFYQQAYSLVTSQAARNAFDLSQEPAEVRERYGFDRQNPRRRGVREFGGLPHLGQSMLLARRLIESGVRLVTVCTGRSFDQSWDTHRDHFPLLRRSILPMADRAFSALLEDLAQRGLLDETLVVAVGEFGRTPRIGQITTPAGADAGGRDHWPHCYTALFAGAGTTGGAIYGASDKEAAYPASDPVKPEDIAATIYHAMGVDPETRLRDHLDRPHTIAPGQPITALWAG